MEVAILEPQCVACGLWRLVKSGRINKSKKADNGVHSVRVSRTNYELTGDTGYRVVLAAQASKWLALANSIICTHN